MLIATALGDGVATPVPFDSNVVVDPGAPDTDRPVGATPTLMTTVPPKAVTKDPGSGVKVGATPDTELNESEAELLIAEPDVLEAFTV